MASVLPRLAARAAMSAEENEELAFSMIRGNLQANIGPVLMGYVLTSPPSSKLAERLVNLQLRSRCHSDGNDGTPSCLVLQQSVMRKETEQDPGGELQWKGRDRKS